MTEDYLTDFSDADLTGTIFTDCSFKGTIFAKNILDETKGLPQLVGDNPLGTVTVGVRL